MLLVHLLLLALLGVLGRGRSSSTSPVFVVILCHLKRRWGFPGVEKGRARSVLKRGTNGMAKDFGGVHFFL